MRKRKKELRTRRRLLAGFGCVGSIPLLVRTGVESYRPLEIRYWLTRAAARHAVYGPVETYVDAALSPIFDPCHISFGGVIDVQTEHGYDVSRSGEWPLRVISGSGGSPGVDTGIDVHVLITDGSLRDGSPGLARHTFASVGGAEHMAQAPDRAALDEYRPHTSALYALQLLLHEIGHVLGLEHEHGSIREVEDGVLASPMVSGYAWSQREGHPMYEGSRCGDRFPDSRDGTRYLSMDFSPCAREALQQYRRRRLAV